MFAGAARAAERDNENAVAQAHLRERLARLKKLPSLDKLLSGSTRKRRPKKKQTWQQMLAMTEAWVASHR